MRALQLESATEVNREHLYYSAETHSNRELQPGDYLL
jgi:hypothetical protein